MAAMALREGSAFDPSGFTAFLECQPDLGTKMWPRYVRVSSELPATATNKILKRELVRQGVDAGGEPVWERGERGTVYSLR